MTSLSSDVVLYRTRLTQIEHRSDAMLPDDLLVETVLLNQGDPLIRVGDRDLDTHEALALADMLAAAVAAAIPDAGQCCVRHFGRELNPGELSPPTVGQQALARRRAEHAALLVGMVAGAMQTAAPDPADWLHWHRLVTEDGIMHLTWLSMSPGQVLCHYERQHPAAEVVELAAPGKPLSRVERVCTDCIAAARRDGLA